MITPLPGTTHTKPGSATFPFFGIESVLLDQEGYYWITGRIDDVINVSGHRMGTAEVESVFFFNPVLDACAPSSIFPVSQNK